MTRSVDASTEGVPAERGRAFGVDIESEFRLPGLPPSAHPLSDPARLVRSRRADLEATWPDDAEVLSLRRRHDGRILQRVEAHATEGHLLAWLGWGHYVISRDTSVVRCAPVRAATWRWQRFLVGQVLPFVSALRGYEVFHGSAVATAAHTVAFLGSSTAGKSSLAVALLARGWELVADDVVAVAADDGRALAQPGMGLVNLRRDAARRMDLDPERLGRVIGRDDEGFRVAVPTVSAARRLTAVCLLERTTSDMEPVVEALAAVDPRALLGASFNFILQGPDRLTRQLDVCALLAAAASTYRVAIPPHLGPGEVADRVADALPAAAAPTGT